MVSWHKDFLNSFGFFNYCGCRLGKRLNEIVKYQWFWNLSQRAYCDDFFTFLNIAVPTVFSFKQVSSDQKGI